MRSDSDLNIDLVHLGGWVVCSTIDPHSEHSGPFRVQLARSLKNYLFSLDGPEWVVKPQCVSSSCSLILREAGRYSARLLRLCMAADAAALRERIVKVKHSRLALVTLRHEAVAAAEDATHR
jgi:hypothetical protein